MSDRETAERLGTEIAQKYADAHHKWRSLADTDEITSVIAEALTAARAAERERVQQEIAELRIRAGKVPVHRTPPECRAHGLGAAYGCGFEHAFRGWGAANPYTAAPQYRSWSRGYADGAKRVNRMIAAAIRALGDKEGV